MDRRNGLDRRGFIAGLAVAVPTSLLHGAGFPQSPRVRGGTRVCVFSKHLQWLGYEEMAEFASEVGFDGIDLTVRPGGHVPPGEVQERLPEAVRAVRAAGLEVPLMTTSIVDPEDPETRKILSVAADNGIRFYRLGYYRYPDSGRIEETLQEIRSKLAGLARLNEEYGLRGDYQNHAGKNFFGASVWDLWEATRDIDPRWIGSQFDLRHATVEGAMNWPVDFRLVSKRVHTVVAKDFRWRTGASGPEVENCPLGEGMCRFGQFFQLLKAADFHGPVSLHLEYPLGGLESGARELTVDEPVVFRAMRRDLGVLRKFLSESGL